MEIQVNEMHMTSNFKNEWKVFREPVKTLGELQEALDISGDFIWLRVVNFIYRNTIRYISERCDDLPDDTKIELIGARYTKDGAIAIVRIIQEKYRRPY